MKTFKLSRALRAALIGIAVIGSASIARADIKDYEFQLIDQTVKAGSDKTITVRLVNKATGKSVPDAVIFATRLDMAPDGMQEMATKIAPITSAEPGTYKFKATFGMAGRWQLSLGAKVQRAIAGVTVAALIAAAGGGFIGVRRHLHLTAAPLVSTALAQTSDDPIYYQDPDGKPFYSLTPKKVPDGRDYRAVPAGADLSFDDEPAAAPATAAATDRKIKFYRNPMGLPDTSPTPKKDSMGMDYIPVYEGEDTDDGSVKLSPGKIQRTGVKSEPASQRIIRTAIRAPGTIQLDERRASIVSFRF